MRRSSRGRKGNIVVDAVNGVLAGAAATWLMGQLTTLLYEKEDERAREREDAARGGKTSYGVAAERTASAVGRELAEAERKKAGAALHWVLGSGTGAVYAALAPRVPGVDAGFGLAFGTAFWLVMDEGATAVLGLTPGPRAFPWQTHARGLAGHLLYGLGLYATVRTLRAIE